MRFGPVLLVSILGATPCSGLHIQGSLLVVGGLGLNLYLLHEGQVSALPSVLFIQPWSSDFKEWKKTRIKRNSIRTRHFPRRQPKNLV